MDYKKTDDDINLAPWCFHCRKHFDGKNTVRQSPENRQRYRFKNNFVLIECCKNCALEFDERYKEQLGHNAKEQKNTNTED